MLSLLILCVLLQTWGSAWADQEYAPLSKVGFLQLALHVGVLALYWYFACAICTAASAATLPYPTIVYPYLTIIVPMHGLVSAKCESARHRSMQLACCPRQCKCAWYERGWPAGAKSVACGQAVFGLERLVDRTIAKRVPKVAYGTSFALRFANNVVGGENFIDMARWAGIQ